MGTLGHLEAVPKEGEVVDLGPRRANSQSREQRKEVFYAAFSLLFKKSMNTEEISLKER